MALQVSLGFSSGYAYAIARNKEDEVKQGGNHLQGAYFQAMQVGQVTSVTGSLINHIPNPAIRIPASLINKSLPFGSMICCPTAALVKQGSYEKAAKATNVLMKAYSPKLAKFYELPETLGENTTHFFKYMAEHTGDISRVALLSSAAILPFLGSPVFAASVIAPILYEAADSRGMVRREVSLFIENYMPMVSNVALLLGGGLFSQATSGLSLASHSSRLNRYAHQKMDQIASRVFALEGGPSLAMIDGPVENSKYLSFKKINEILDAQPEDFEINIVHCSKWATGLANIPEDRDFNKFLKIFKGIAWDQKYGMLKRSFQDDDRFIELLQAQIPDKNDYKEQFESYVESLAIAAEQTKEQYLASQLENQMIQLVKTLSGDIRAKGSQADLDEAIVCCAKIVHHLSNLDPQKDQIEIEDTLCKLAVEGGEYCARGIKRAAGELLNGIFQQGIKKKGVKVDPVVDYENRIRQHFQRYRLNILEGLFSKVMGVVADQMGPSREVAAVTEDVHTFDIYRKAFALGFYPLTDYERDSFGMGDFINWETPAYRQLREMMFDTYGRNIESTVEEAVREIGLIHFPNYMRQVLASNHKLSDDDVETLMGDKYANCNDGEWSPEETQQKFYRLMLVFLGILQKKAPVIPLEEDWVEVEEEKWSLV